MKEYNDYYYQALKTLYDNYKKGYQMDPFNDFLFSDIRSIVEENKLNLEKYQKSKDYKKILDELKASWNKQGECYYGYDDNASKDYRDAAMSVDEIISSTILPNGETLDDPDGSKRKKVEEYNKKIENTPFCDEYITKTALERDLIKFGEEYMKEYLSKEYPNMEWKELFNALVNEEELTFELEQFYLKKSVKY